MEDLDKGEVVFVMGKGRNDDNNGIQKFNGPGRGERMRRR